MVGQFNNKTAVSSWREKGRVPRFIIITGEEGSGRYTLAQYIARTGIDGYIVDCENGVEAVREVLETAYKSNSNNVYIFRNADKMSSAAKNALLKITEEPPKCGYFIMTMENVNNTLPTLKSRGTELKMEVYSSSDLREFTTDGDILSIAQNPGQIKKLQEINVKVFLEFCEKVLDSIKTVSGVNAFKIAASMKFKEDGEGYDPVLFLNAMIMLCSMRIWAKVEQADIDIDAFTKLASIVKACSDAKKDMQNVGLKKDSTFDTWVLKMRAIL